MKRSEKVCVAAAACFGVLGLFCVIFRFFGMRFSGFLCIGVALLLLLFFFLGRLGRRRQIWKKLRMLLCAAVVVGLAVFAVLEAQVIRAAHSVPAPADAVIVLGAGVNGTQPSLALKTRLDAALAYALDYPDVPLVLSGGQGYGEEISEAECMYRYLTEKGIAPERLLLEEQARNTEENFRFSKAVLEENGYEVGRMTVAVVSNDFHLCRAELLARREGITPTGVGAPIPWLHLELNYYIREAFALAKAYVL